MTRKDRRHTGGAREVSDTYRTRCDWGEHDGLVISISEGITHVTGRDLADVAPIDESIDADALSRLFRPPRRGPIRSLGTITFRHEGCRVTVHANGKVVVRSMED